MKTYSSRYVRMLAVKLKDLMLFILRVKTLACALMQTRTFFVTFCHLSLMVLESHVYVCMLTSRLSVTVFMGEITKLFLEKTHLAGS